MKIFFKNIAICGRIGTGKTTLATNLAKRLGWKHLNIGEFVRGWYKKNGIDLNETDQIPEEVDKKLDGDFQKKMQEDSHIIFESRLAGWQARDLKAVFKILCTVDHHEAIKRAAKRDKVSLKEAGKIVHERDEGLRQKFIRLYGVSDYLDPKYFDLVVDTTTKTPEEVLEEVLQALGKK